MIFYSFTFLIFFLLVFLLYYFPLKENTKAQNWLLLLSSYFFCGYADWKTVPIILVATLSVFFLGKAIHTITSPKKSSLLTTLGVLISVGLLAYFKYFNFFIASFSSALNAIGLQSNIGTFNIIMPLGISYFTFKLISYIIELQRGKIEYCNDFVAFSTYIAFFPTLLSGPLDRPNIFIPQLQKKRSFDYDLVIDGCRQILWGLFQKIVIADTLAAPINKVWNNLHNCTGSTLFITAILYSIQVYTDFSGYSHIAIGVGKILGFRITKNFNYPYFSRNVAEFWSNWHISLTSWFTDHVFMPLNIKFRSLGKLGLLLAIIVNMLVIGIWHGDNWTFVVFGLCNGLLFMPLIFTSSIFNKKKLETNKYDLPTLMDFIRIVGTFMSLTLGFILFRAENLKQAYLFILGIFDPSFFPIQSFLIIENIPYVFIIMLFYFEWTMRELEFPLSRLNLEIYHSYNRYVIYYIIVFMIFWFSNKQHEFIYFQF